MINIKKFFTKRKNSFSDYEDFRPKYFIIDGLYLTSEYNYWIMESNDEIKEDAIYLISDERYEDELKKWFVQEGKIYGINDYI